MNIALIFIITVLTISTTSLIGLTLKRPKNNEYNLNLKNPLESRKFEYSDDQPDSNNVFAPGKYLTMQNANQFFLFCESENKFLNNDLIEINGKLCALLKKEKNICGRVAASDIILNDKSISRMHFIISIKNGECTITDCNSTNGTFVNNLRTVKQSLYPGDKISVGETTMIFGRKD